MKARTNVKAGEAGGAWSGVYEQFDEPQIACVQKGNDVACTSVDHWTHMRFQVDGLTATHSNDTTTITAELDGQGIAWSNNSRWDRIA